jgi:hypothetical protein
VAGQALRACCVCHCHQLRLVISAQHQLGAFGQLLQQQQQQQQQQQPSSSSAAGGTS